MLLKLKHKELWLSLTREEIEPLLRSASTSETSEKSKPAVNQPEPQPDLAVAAVEEKQPIEKALEELMDEFDAEEDECKAQPEANATAGPAEPAATDTVLDATPTLEVENETERASASADFTSGAGGEVDDQQNQNPCAATATSIQGECEVGSSSHESHGEQPDATEMSKSISASAEKDTDTASAKASTTAAVQIMTTAEETDAKIDASGGADISEATQNDKAPAGASQCSQVLHSDSVLNTLNVSSNRSRKIASSLAEADLFYDDCLSTILEENNDDAIMGLFDALFDSEDTMSTSFSGIEAAGTAMNCLRHSWCKRTKAPFKHQRILFQIEWNTACCQELLPHAKQHNICLFSNIQHFFRPELDDTVNRLLQKPHLAVEILGPLLSSGNAMRKEAPCLTHGKQCAVRSARRHIAGTSCKPYSRKGSQMSQGDPETLFTLAWLGMRLTLQEPIIVSENVKTTGPGSATLATIARHDGMKGLPVQDAGLGNLVIRFLDAHYWMETTILDPALLGFPFSREREFIVMRRKVKCLPMLSPKARFQKRFFRACAWSWKEIFMMHHPKVQGHGVVAHECEQDILWARGRPTSMGQMLALDTISVENLQDPDIWEWSLTSSELRFLGQYRSGWPNTAYQLNQDPASGHGHKAGQHAMFTLINNCGLIWNDTATPSRWMTATEALMCQGFPVIPLLHDPKDCLSVFSLENSQRNGRHTCAQAGNSMHCAVMALIQLYTLSEIPLRPVCPLFKHIQSAREHIRSAKKRSSREAYLDMDVSSPSRPLVRVRGKSDGMAMAAANHAAMSLL